MSRLSFHRAALVTALVSIFAGGCATAGAQSPRKTLTAFANEQEIAQLFARWQEAHQRRIAEAQRKREAERRQFADSASQPAPAAPAMAKAEPAVTGAADSITNVQHAGVDEGGIVKLHGDHLVILRRG